MYSIIFEDVVKTYKLKGRGKKTVVTANQNLSFKVQKGEIFGLLGPNGSGKTTVVKLLTGLLASDKGKIEILGNDPIKDWKSVRHSLGLVPQDTSLYPELTANQNLEFYAALYMRDKFRIKERIKFILNLVELEQRAKDKVKTFSGGMKRRLAIGRALLHDPEILLLDEPTLGVDVQGSHRIWEYIRNLAAEGKTILVTTNVMSEADYLCDHLLIIDHGKNIAFDTVDNLKKSLGIKEITVKKKPTLDDVFLHYTGKSLRD